MQVWKRALANIIIQGILPITRAVINEQQGKNGKYELLAEGYGLRDL